MEYEHERDLAEAHEFGHHGADIALEHPAIHGSEWTAGHVAHIEEEPSWRDDHYHDHTGFNLQPVHYEMDHRGMHHYNQVGEEAQEEDGVEHYDNERYHQQYSQMRPYGQFLQ